MPDRPATHFLLAPLDCPVCLGVRLARVQLGPGPDLVLDTCPRCGGIWFDRGEVARLRKYQPKALWKKVTPRQEAYRVPCQRCGALIDRNALHCLACGRANAINCPACGAGVTLVRSATLGVDACNRCRGAWFDAVELAKIWNGELDKALAREARDATALGRSRGEVPTVVDALADPFLTIWMMDGAADAAGAVAMGAGELIGSAPEVAAAAVEGTARLASHVFEAIAAIVEGIFS